MVGGAAVGAGAGAAVSFKVTDAPLAMEICEPPMVDVATFAPLPMVVCDELVRIGDVSPSVTGDCAPDVLPVPCFEACVLALLPESKQPIVGIKK